MATSYLTYEPQQQRLLPDALQDWLPESQLAYFISVSVDSLDLSAFHARYSKGGPRNQPFHPAMMVKERESAMVPSSICPGHNRVPDTAGERPARRI